MDNYAKAWLKFYNEHGKQKWEVKKQEEIEVRGKNFVDRVVAIMTNEWKKRR